MRVGRDGKSPITDEQRHWQWSMGGLVLLAFLIRVAGLEAQSLWRDEIDAIRFSLAPWTELLAYFTRPGWNGPLYYVILRGWLSVTGQSAFALRFFSTWWGVLTVPLIGVLGRRWFDQRIGSIAALFVTTSPYLIWYAQEGKMYAMLLTLVLSTILALDAAVRRGGWRWIAVILGISLSVYTHILAIFLVPLLVALWVLWWPWSARRRREALIALVILVLLHLPLLRWGIPYLRSRGKTGFPFYPLGQMVGMLLSGWSQGVTSGLGILGMGLWIFLLLAGTCLSGGQRQRGLRAWWQAWHDRWRWARWVPSLILWLILPIGGVYLLCLWMPLFTDRYLIWCAPAFYLLAARGVVLLGRRSPWVARTALAAVLTLNLSAILVQTFTPIKADFRAAAAYVRENRRPEELIVFHISYIRYNFEYYYGDASPWTEGVPAGTTLSPDDVDTLMRQRTAGYKTVWLVLSEPEMWDPRHLTEAWFEQHGTLLARRDFARVSVLTYRLP